MKGETTDGKPAMRLPIVQADAAFSGGESTAVVDRTILSTKNNKLKAGEAVVFDLAGIKKSFLQMGLDQAMLAQQGTAAFGAGNAFTTPRKRIASGTSDMTGPPTSEKKCKIFDVAGQRADIKSTAKAFCSKVGKMITTQLEKCNTCITNASTDQEKVDKYELAEHVEICKRRQSHMPNSKAWMIGITR